MYSALPAYAELHCLSNFTFLRGASHATELVARAAELGYAALAITDECSLAGVVRAHVAAREAGLHLIIGSEIRLEDGPRLVLLAADRAGYGRLSSLITLGRRREKKGSYRLLRADIEAGLPGCLALLLPDEHTAAPEARWLAQCFGDRGWIAAALHSGPDDRAKLAGLRELAQGSGLPLVAAGGVLMHKRSRQPLQDVLTAIRLRKGVAHCGHALEPNAERHLRQRMRLAQVYPPELLAATLDIAAQCTFSLDSLRYEYPEELVPAGETPAGHLRKLTLRGLQKRFPQGVSDKVAALVEHELMLIAELAYEPFFLTVEDIVSFAKRSGILCQGRGSAANSAVCYALGITEVDPARMSMLFERFISRERNEPPDIDVDFEHERREEVIQYIYKKYGRERAALAATVICYRPKSALRDAGKALGLENDQVERLSRAIVWWDDRKDLAARFREAGFDPESALMRRLSAIADTLMGFPRHLSQHVGGFVISRGPLAELVPIENAAMAERSVIEWDKDDLDALGLLKVDVLALGMLTAIRRTFDMVSLRRGLPFGMGDVPAEDAATYAMLQQGDSVGVFQVESRAQMSMLPRLRPERFYDLVIEVAIVRPGPIQGGMVHPYLRRRQGLEPVVYPSEAVRGVLERTLGVPIFQEQVMQLAVVAAGFTPGEADHLRRSMAAWKKKGGLEHLESRLVSGMLQRGYKPEFAKAIYQQILGFGNYGFPESHSASFALLAYVSAWLKRHEPAAFLAALLNSQPMGFYAPAQLVQDAKRHGVEVRAVDVQVSAYECTLEACDGDGGDVAVRLGLVMVGGLSAAGARRAVAARAGGAFETVADVAGRAGLDVRDMKALAAAGALAALSGHRRRAYWDVAGIRAQAGLFAEERVIESAPLLDAPSEGANIVADYQSTGLTLGRHPLALLRKRLAELRFATAGQIGELPKGRLVRACGIVTCRQRPGTASGVVFVTLEDETGCVNVVVWKDLSARQRSELLGSSLMGVEGVIEREGGVVHLMAKRLFDHSRMLGRLNTSSRDFH
jgi:error-prone DNA polymerase